MVKRTVQKKNTKELTRFEAFYDKFSDMSKVNFLGTALKKYFEEKIIGKDPNSVEYDEIKAIIAVLEDDFVD